MRIGIGGGRGSGGDGAQDWTSNVKVGGSWDWRHLRLLSMIRERSEWVGGWRAPARERGEIMTRRNGEKETGNSKGRGRIKQEGGDYTSMVEMKRGCSCS